jgi:hypothetical protein
MRCVSDKLRGHVNECADLPFHLLEATVVKLGTESEVRNFDY